MEPFFPFVITILLSLGVGGVVYVACARFGGIAPAARFSPRWADYGFGALVGAYVLVFATLAILRHLNFCTGYLGVCTAWDLAQYDQIIWNSLHGRLFENSFIRDANSFLGKTFTPILLAFVPLYAVWSSPLVLLIAQTLALGAGAFPIYWFARARVGYPLALTVVLAYFLYPGLEYMNLAEFHEIPFATPALAFATFFLLRRQYKGFLVSVLIALLIKEEIALVAIALGVYVFLIQRSGKLGVGLMIFGVAWGVALLQYIIPFFRGAEYGGAFYYFGEGEIGGGGTRYGYLGRSVPEIITTLLTRPDFVAQHVLVPEKIKYVLHLLTPLLFTPLIGAEVAALALPTLGYSLLSQYGLQYEIGSYYFAPLLPFLFFGMVVGLQRVLRWNGLPGRALNSAAWRAALIAGLGAASVSSYLLHAPGPFAAGFQAWRYTLSEHSSLGNRLVASVPVGAFVVAQNEYMAHLSRREFVYEIPIPDYRQVDYLFADTTQKWFSIHAAHWKHALGSGYFESLVQQDGYIIARRKTSEHRLDVRYGDEMTLIGYNLALTDTLRGGQIFRPIFEWRAEREMATRYQIVVRVLDAQGHLWAEEDREPLEGNLPTPRWRVDKIVGDQHTLRLHPAMPPGEYHIVVGVHRADHSHQLVARDAQGNALGTEVEIATVRVEKNKTSFTASDLAKEQPLVAHFVDLQEIRLLGYYPPRETISPGEVLPIGLYWKAREKPRGDYLVAVQLRDASGRVAFEQIARPANNAYPTTQWDVGEVLLDWHDFDLPRDLAIGNYQISVVLRDAATGTRVGETLISTISVVK